MTASLKDSLKKTKVAEIKRTYSSFFLFLVFLTQNGKGESRFILQFEKVMLLDLIVIRNGFFRLEK